jgi:hypothetical protein
MKAKDNVHKFLSIPLGIKRKILGSRRYKREVKNAKIVNIKNLVKGKV